MTRQIVVNFHVSRNLERRVPVMNSLCSCHQPSQHLTHSSVAGDEHNLQSLRRKLESNLCLVEVQMDFFPLGLTVLGNFRHFSVDAGLKAQQVFL